LTNIALLLLVVFFSVIVFGQKTESDKKDDFRNVRQIITSGEVLVKKYGDNGLKTNSSKIFIQIKESADTSINSNFYFISNATTSIDDKNKVFLKFQDGSIYEDFNFGTYKIISSGEVGSASLTFASTDKRLDTLNGFLEKRITK